MSFGKFDCMQDTHLFLKDIDKMQHLLITTVGVIYCSAFAKYVWGNKVQNSIRDVKCKNVKSSI